MGFLDKFVPKPSEEFENPDKFEDCLSCRVFGMSCSFETSFDCSDSDRIDCSHCCRGLHLLLGNEAAERITQKDRIEPVKVQVRFETAGNNPAVCSLCRNGSLPDSQLRGGILSIMVLAMDLCFGSALMHQLIVRAL